MRPRIKLLIDCWKTTSLRWQNITKNYLKWDIIPMWARNNLLDQNIQRTLLTWIKLEWYPDWNNYAQFMTLLEKEQELTLSASPAKFDSWNQIQHIQPNIKNIILSGKLVLTYSIISVTLCTIENSWRLAWKLIGLVRTGLGKLTSTLPCLHKAEIDIRSHDFSQLKKFRTLEKEQVVIYPADTYLGWLKSVHTFVHKIQDTWKGANSTLPCWLKCDHIIVHNKRNSRHLKSTLPCWHIARRTRGGAGGRNPE